MAAIDLSAMVVDYPDFPIPGIVFKDIMPLLGDPGALREARDAIVAWAAPRRPEVVVAVDARGFILGGAVACELGCGFVPLRKAGKLPGETVAVEFSGEYATDTLEVQRDAIRPGTRVLVHDDLMATGNCGRAAAGLVEELGGIVVGLAFLVELTFLGGRERVAGYDVLSLIRY
jgi:adenine phosphoribosyltransferase